MILDFKKLLSATTMWEHSFGGNESLALLLANSSLSELSMLKQFEYLEFGPFHICTNKKTHFCTFCILPALSKEPKQVLKAVN